MIEVDMKNEWVKKGVKRKVYDYITDWIRYEERKKERKKERQIIWIDRSKYEKWMSEKGNGNISRLN